MLIYRNAEAVHGQRKFGNTCLRGNTGNENMVALKFAHLGSKISSAIRLFVPAFTVPMNCLIYKKT